MQTTMHQAFQEKVEGLKALLEYSKLVKAEAMAKVSAGSPRYQAFGKAGTWDVVEIATGAVQGFAFSYRAAIRFVDAMEAGAASKTGTRQ
ncbi:hypothetical protein [Pseudomonas pudica]|uniref:Uncharacterized protein n=1 Tax=Pseudomonas pudica TaxID=272772 RepID=A0ABS0G2R0_9PSED|nr:hypothetical protein [Pseudomonas pudica]MBF8646846.1 hypothetical protein [Pseudomonas pudica]MBF8760814.1 hypothetical protein [Pseudomonas pudica]